MSQYFELPSQTVLFHKFAYIALYWYLWGDEQLVYIITSGVGCRKSKFLLCIAIAVPGFKPKLTCIYDC